MFQLVGEVPFLQSCSRKAASVMHVVFETSSRRLTSQKPGEEPLNFHEGLQGPERRRFWHHKLKHLGRLQCYGVARIIFKVVWGGGVLPSAGRACARHVTRSIALSCRARLRGYNGPPLNLPTFGGTGPDAGGPTWWGNPENPFRKCGCWAMLLPHVYECSSCCRRSLHAGNLVAEAHTLKNPNEL